MSGQSFESAGACPPEDRPPTRPVRLAFCIDNMQLGGTELNALRTAERLDRSRYDLRVIALQEDGPLVARYEAAGVPVERFPLRSLYGANALRQGVRLRWYLRSNRIQILHAQDIYSLVFAIPWARAARVATVASRRWWDPLPGVHWRLATRAGYRAAHATVANSPRVADLVRRVEGVRPERIFVVPNFVDEDAFRVLLPEERGALRGELGIRESERVIGIVANLLPVKDHATLIRAFALLAPTRPDLRLVLVGDGPCRQPLMDLTRELGLESCVVFAGRRAPVANLHALFDISVLCSTGEGLPNSLVEAMAAGKPIVATDVGGVPDVVTDGENGLLVPPRDPARLAAALERLLLNPTLAERLGEAGRGRARRAHTPNAALRALDEVYDHVLGRVAKATSPDPPRPLSAAASR